MPERKGRLGGLCVVNLNRYYHNSIISAHVLFMNDFSRTCAPPAWASEGPAAVTTSLDHRGLPSVVTM